MNNAKNPDQKENADSTLTLSVIKDTEPLLNTTALEYPRGTIAVDLKKSCKIMMCVPCVKISTKFDVKLLLLGFLICMMMAIVSCSRQENPFNIFQTLKFVEGTFHDDGARDVKGIKILDYTTTIYYQCPFGKFWKEMPLDRSITCMIPQSRINGWRLCFWIGAQCVCEPNRSPGNSKRICFIGVPVRPKSTSTTSQQTTTRKSTTTKDTTTLRTITTEKHEATNGESISLVNMFFRFVPLDIPSTTDRITTPAVGPIVETLNDFNFAQPITRITPKMNNRTKRINIILIVLICVLCASIISTLICLTITYYRRVKQLTKTERIFQKLRHQYEGPPMMIRSNLMSMTSIRFNDDGEEQSPAYDWHEDSMFITPWKNYHGEISEV